MKLLSSLLRVVVPALLAGLLLTGCPVQSLHPLFDEKVEPAPLDRALLGSWQSDKGADDKPATLIIAEEGNHYMVTYSEEGATTELRGVPVQVGQQRYLDLWIQSLEQFHVPLPAAVHLVPSHSFWRVSLDGDALSCAYLDYDALEKAFKAKKVALAHTEIEDAQIVTASPAELRAFLPGFAAGPDAFSKPLGFHRRK